MDLGLDAESGGDAVGDAPYFGFHVGLGFFLEGARGAAQDDFFGNHVPGIARVHLGDGHHGGVERADRAAGDRLQCCDELRARNHRVAPQLGQGGMGAGAGQRDLEYIERCHDRAGADREFTRRYARHVVHAVDRFHREFVEQAFLDHHAAAAFVFLRRLEDEMYRAGEVLRFRQVFRRAQQHGRMPVMAAGMHLAGVFGLVIDLVLFLDIERIHIGAQTDGGAVAFFAAQRADHAGTRKAAMHIDAEFMQPQCHVIRCLVFLERGFRMLVDMTPPRGHVVLEFGNTVDDRHGRVSA